MANWTFTADSDLQLKISEKLDLASKDFKEKYKELYGEIDSMGTNQYWVGDDYNNFSTGVHNYETALQDLSDSMKMFSEHFTRVSEGTETLASDLIAIVNDLTGTGYVSGSNGNGYNASNPGVNGNDPNGAISNNNNTNTNTNNDDSSNGNGSTNGNDNNGTPGVLGGDVNGASDDNLDTNNNDNSQTSDTIDMSDTTQDTNTENTTNTITGHSGDLVEIDGNKYSVYGYVQKPNGEVVTMYADNSNGKLYYMPASGSLEEVKATYINGSGGTSSIEATINSIGSTQEITVRGGYKLNQPVTLNVDGVSIRSASDVSTEAVLSGNSIHDNVTYTGESIGTNYNLSGENLVSTTKYTMYSAQTGQEVNGYTIGVPTSMQSLVEMANNETDVIRLEPQYKVQWDDPAGGVGYTFENSQEPVFLLRTTDGSGYQLADEYGNVINTRIFTLDGFNTNGGASGGVWKNR